jgi:hypothetical protein
MADQQNTPRTNTNDPAAKGAGSFHVDPAGTRAFTDPDRSDADRRNGGTPPAAAMSGSVVDRRLGLDRRTIQQMQEGDAESNSGLERRRGRGRRLSDFTKSAEEGEMTKEQFLFLMAIDQFKKSNATAFPTWTDVLEIVRLLGYRKTMASEIKLNNAEDWREQPTTPANVRPQRWAQRAEIDRQRERDAA